MSDTQFDANQEQAETPQEEKVWTEEPSVASVKIKDKTGQVRDYTIREFEGEGLSQWMANQASVVKFDKRGVRLPVDKTTFRRLHARQIGLCLYDADGKKVSESVIASWPSSLQQHLYQKCMDVNGLGEDGTEKAKNV